MKKTDIIQLSAIGLLILSNNLIGQMLIDAIVTSYDKFLEYSPYMTGIALVALLGVYLYNQREARKKEDQRLEGLKKGHKGPKRER